LASEALTGFGELKISSSSSSLRVVSFYPILFSISARRRRKRGRAYSSVLGLGDPEKYD
jgi:hypothetical protein